MGVEVDHLDRIGALVDFGAHGFTNLRVRLACSETQQAGLLACFHARRRGPTVAPSDPPRERSQSCCQVCILVCVGGELTSSTRYCLSRLATVSLSHTTSSGSIKLVIRFLHLTRKTKTKKQNEGLPTDNLNLYFKLTPLLSSLVSSYKEPKLLPNGGRLALKS